jgi:hypothetical protein
MTILDTRPVKPDAATLRSLKCGKLYWSTVSAVWDAVSIYDGAATFLEQFGSISESQGLLMAAHWCQSEVCNGGFHQFFSNSTGVLAPEATRGFEFIQLPEVASVVARCVHMLGEQYPRDRAERTRALKKLERPGTDRSEWDPFSSMDKEFYRLTGTRKFDEQADSFVRSHMDLFFRGSAG